MYGVVYGVVYLFVLLLASRAVVYLLLCCFCVLYFDVVFEVFVYCVVCLLCARDCFFVMFVSL